MFITIVMGVTSPIAQLRWSLPRGVLTCIHICFGGLWEYCPLFSTVTEWNPNFWTNRPYSIARRVRFEHTNNWFGVNQIRPLSLPTNFLKLGLRSYRKLRTELLAMIYSQTCALALTSPSPYWVDFEHCICYYLVCWKGGSWIPLVWFSVRCIHHVCHLPIIIYFLQRYEKLF